jgi:hypothetical protein
MLTSVKFCVSYVIMVSLVLTGLQHIYSIVT